MKKILFSLLLIFSATILFTTSNTHAEGMGNVVVHFQKWDGDYTDVGLNSWGWPEDSSIPGGQQGPTALKTLTKTDDFGVYWEFKNVPIDTTGSYGLQMVGADNIGTDQEALNWSKVYGNFEILKKDVVAGKTVHLYAFQGGNTRTNHEKDALGVLDYLVADPDKQGIIITYFDSANAYEENLGVYNWGWQENAVDFNNPHKIFKNVGKSVAGVPVKAGILYYTETAPGVIIYYGDGDSSKKTGDLKPKDADNKAAIAIFFI